MVYFHTKNPNLDNFFEGHRMENICIFYNHLEYFTAIWNNLWPFGIVCSIMVCFSHFGRFGPRKIWQPFVAPLLMISMDKLLMISMYGVLCLNRHWA
jgi:hypothetical protein